MAHLRKNTRLPTRYQEEDEQERNTTIGNTEEEEEYSPYSKSSRRSHSPPHHYRYGMPILISLMVLSSICSFVSVKLQTTPQNLVLLGGVAQEPLHSSTRFGVTPMDIPHAKEIVLMTNNEEKKKEKEGEEGDVRQMVVQEGEEMEKVSSRRGRRRLQEGDEEEEEGEEEGEEEEEEKTEEGEEEEEEESDEQQEQFENHLHTHTLTPKSVILITGAAGYLGSELAMALYQTYNIETILCIDNFDSSYTGGGPFSASSSSGAALTDSQWAAKLSLEEHSGKETTRSLAERDLTLLEYKRQRTFRLLRSIPKVKFYKTDIRPSIPEYFDVGGVPVLDNVFDRYTDISHVVHLADAYQPHNGQEDEGQAVPRVREQTKTGMMEVILEQIYKEEKRREILYKEMEERKKVDGDDHLPPKKIQFVFGSSYEVYNGVNSRYGSSIKAGNAADDEEKKEDRALTTASSLHGASKILDELLASTYGHLYGINSVGLRFFPVYGPWSPPGSALFDMAEMAVSDSNVSLFGSKGAAADAKDKGDDEEEDGDADTSNPPKTQFLPQDGVDFVYIDDAVDAILSAMQYQIPKGVTSPVVFNVGSGQSNTLNDISKLMEEHFPRSSNDAANNPPLSPPPNEKRAPVTFRANIQRANNHLGWSPHTTLQDGIASLLAWHYDRAFPYGPPPPQSQSTTTVTRQPPSIISTHGIANCNPFDIECLRGATVYPCASECANPNICHPTIYDSSIPKLQQLTQNCDIVLYTVALGQETTKQDIPNGIKYKVKPDGRTYVPSSQDGQQCNIAFVSQNSPIVTEADDNNKHGYWYLIPLPSTATITRGEQLLPKLSPSKLFHPTVTKAIFVNPNILIADIPTLLKQWNYHPFSSPSYGQSASSSSQTALMGERKQIPKPKGPSYTFSTLQTTNHMDEYAARQERAYNMMKVGLHGEMKYDKVILPTTNTNSTSTSSTTTTTAPPPHHEDYNIMGSSDWLVHGLNVEDARSFRCDVYGDVLQWNVQVEDTAFDFMLGLHDLWSRIIVQWAGFEPWWKNVKVEKGESHIHHEKKKKKEKMQKENDHDEKKENGENDKEEQEEEDEKEYMDVGSWMGMLSSKYTYYFVRILPPSKDLIVRLNSK